MGWFDGWPFKSKEQLERERKEFEDRVFPLGPAQREAALAVLRQGLRPKLKDEEKLFAYISAKDAFVLGGGVSDNGEARAEKALRNQKWLSDEDRRFVLALLHLEAGADTLAAYPGYEDVQQSNYMQSTGEE